MQRRVKNTFAVIADDLTGAVDVGAQFRKFGYQIAVFNGTRKAEEASATTDILIINTQSREKPVDVACKEIVEAFRFLRERKVRRIFLKIDTAFRGNAVAAILSLFDEMKPRIVLVAPSIPEMKRITVGGYQLFGTTPIERTHYSKDPSHPVIESHIPTLLANRTGRKVKHIELSLVMKKCARLGFRDAVKEGTNIVVADAVSQEDLNHIAESASELGMLNLTVGSLGLARAVLRVSDLQRTGTLEAITGRVPERPILIVSGTYHPQTVMQIEHASRTLGISIMDLDASALCEDYGSQIKEVSGLVNDALASGKDVILRTAHDLDDAKRCLSEAERKGVSSAKLDELILEGLGKIVRNVCKNSGISCVVATGGNVCFAVCMGLGASALRVVKEVSPAVVHSLLVGGEFDGISLVSKGGSIGDKNTYVKILNYLDELKKDSVSGGN
jgi:uncharacterized protein YgbK (DUF1537 family)